MKMKQVKVKEPTLQEKLVALTEEALVKNDKGEERKVVTSMYVAYVVETESAEVDNLPVAFTIFRESGENVFEWREPSYRGSKRLLATRLNVIKNAIAGGAMNPLSGYIFGWVDPDNIAEVEYFRKMGCHLEEEIVKGKKWIKIYTHVSEFMTDGKVIER
jgi:hypothetical protein